MKPNFILELSHDGVRLRAAGGGASDVLGSVSLSDTDFDSKVAALRNSVAEKADAPMATELRIPDSEILYTTLDDPEPTGKITPEKRKELREAAVRDALEGMTPYSLADLNFTWRIKTKGEICVAAVAHETLAEAEQFAASRSFNPVSFAAAPGNDKFKGTADFGPTALIIKRAEAEARAKAEEKAAALAEAEAAAKAPPPSPTETSPPDVSATQTADAPADTAKIPKDTKPEKADSRLGEDSSKPIQAETPAAEPKAGTKPAADPPSAVASGAARRITISPGPQDVSAPDDDAPPKVEAPRTGFSQPRINDPLPPADDSGVIDDVPPMPMSFATRRKAMETVAPPKSPDASKPETKKSGALKPGAAADPGAALDGDSRLSKIAARFAITPGAGDATPPPPPRRTVASGAKPPLRGSAEKPGALRPAGARPAVALPDASVASASLTPLTDATGKPLLPPARDAVSARLAKGGKLNESEAMTVFGARAADPGKSLTPLIIGIALAAALAIAVWVAFFLLSDTQVANDVTVPSPETTAAVVPSTAPETPATVPETTPEPTTETVDAPDTAQPMPDTDVAGLPQSQEPGEAPSGRVMEPDSTVATLGPVAPAAPIADGLPNTEAPPPALANDPLQRPPSEGENPVGRYATTGVWIDTPAAPDTPTTDRVDEIYTASVDPEFGAETFRPGPALPELSAPRAMLPQRPPAPPGQDFDLNNQGLVRATPEGAISPDGVLITTGRPAVTPPNRPERPQSLTPTAVTQPDLPRTRPRDRPEDLVDENEQTSLIPPAEDAPAQAVDTQRAALQPRARPTDIIARVEEEIQDRARAAALAVTGASTATPQAPLATQPPRPAPANLAALRPTPPPVVAEPEPEVLAAPAAPISPYAVASSRLPKAKPRNIDRLVAQARARAPQVQERQQAVTRVASAAAVTTPRIPSRASVATQATVKNAINLGKINLIGVYGSTSNRRALVRLPSGKFVKVKVGDRVDGGRVAAIGQSELSYTKSGRRVTLSMPRG